MNFKGLPDTLSIDPAVKYNIQVHTLPEVWKKDVDVIAGQHNIIPIETPQGSIELKLLEGRIRDLKFIVREEGECDVTNIQNFRDKVNYIVGTYDVEILTLPRIKMSVTSVNNFQYVLKIAARYHIMIKLQYDTR